jgi:hypothetical protein
MDNRFLKRAFLLDTEGACLDRAPSGYNDL